jgi:hypothetical protein
MVLRRFEFNIPMSDIDHDKEAKDAPEPRKELAPAAKRALAEAEARRRAEKPDDMPVEVGGRGGADPARYGDWEINGRAIDF